MLPQPRPATEPESHAHLLADFPRVTGGLRSPATRGVLAYWRALVPGAGCVPHRRAVDPIGIGGRLLPHIFLCQYAADGRILIRLQGSYLAEQAGQTMTGRHIDQSTFGTNAPAILRLYETVRATRCPLATHETVLTTRHDVIPCEVLHLPLLRDVPGTPGATEIGYVLGALDRLDDGLLPRHALQAKEVESIHVVDGI